MDAEVFMKDRAHILCIFCCHEALMGCQSHAILDVYHGPMLDNVVVDCVVQYRVLLIELPGFDDVHEGAGCRFAIDMQLVLTTSDADINLAHFDQPIEP